MGEGSMCLFGHLDSLKVLQAITTAEGSMWPPKKSEVFHASLREDLTASEPSIAMPRNCNHVEETKVLAKAA